MVWGHSSELDWPKWVVRTSTSNLVRDAWERGGLILTGKTLGNYILDCPSHRADYLGAEAAMTEASG